MKIDQKNLKIDIFQSEDLNELIKVFSFPWTSFEATKTKWETDIATFLNGGLCLWLICDALNDR